jgi:hypothetical protein
MKQDNPLSPIARVAGIACLLSIVIVVYANFGILDSLVTNDAAETAKNIAAQESLFRFGIICHLVYCIAIVILAAAFYIILRQVNHMLALSAALLRFVYALVWIPITLNYFTALRLAKGHDYLQLVSPDQLHAFAKLSLSGLDAYYVGLLFWALASTICCYLWFKSKYVPKALAVFGFLASLWCVACTFIFMIFPAFSYVVNAWWFDSPMTVFEVVISFWLLIRGIRYVS